MLNLIEQDQTQYWRNHIANFVASNTTQKQYCKANDISYTKFKGWRYKFTDEFPVNQEHPKSKQAKLKHSPAVSSQNTNGNKFAAVKISDACTSQKLTDQPIKLFLNKNIYLDLSLELDINNLQKIFIALGVLQC